MRKLLSISFVLLATGACDGQQYVNPTTVRLLITDDATNATRVDHCDYVPVLLGSEVQATYAVKGDLSAKLSVTRDSITLEFEGGAQPGEPFVLAPADLQRSGTSAENAPDGYSVELSSGCVVPDEN